MKAILTRSGFTQYFAYLKKVFVCLPIVFAFNSSPAQNVGIGIDAPTQKLEVGGNIKGVNILSTGLVGIGTTAPLHKLHIFDGSLGLTSTVDGTTWSVNYSPGFNTLNFVSDGSTRMTLLNTGNLGIGTTSPSYRLDVNGSFRAGSNAVIQGNVTAFNADINGNVTVNDGKGIIQNSQGSGQLKYYTRTATFNLVNFQGFALSSEFGINFTPGIFTNPPKVFVGDIVSTGGTLGELYRVQLIIYNVTTTNCKVRLLNTSPNPISYSTTWNIVCIGD